MSSTGIKGFCRKENSEDAIVGVTVDIGEAEESAKANSKFEHARKQTKSRVNANFTFLHPIIKSRDQPKNFTIIKIHCSGNIPK